MDYLHRYIQMYNKTYWNSIHQHIKINGKFFNKEAKY